MADNVTANAGSGGSTFAAAQFSFSGDTVVAPGGFLFGLTGSEGSWTAGVIPGDATDGLLVNLGSNNDVTVTGTVTANLSATDNTALDLVGTNTGYGTVVGGGAEATALRVTLASDSTGVLSVDDNGGSLTVDNAALSVTGGGVEASALRVTLASDSTGVLSVDDNGSSLTVDNAALSVTGGGVEASALRVTLASDSTGVLSVDDGGGALTVDNAGTFAVQVDAALPAGTNAIGKVDVTSIAAGTNVIGDVGISGVRTSGGTTLYRNVDVDETEDAVKASAGQLYWIHAMNLTASVLYLHFYNATVASVTVGTTTPDLTFALPTPGDTNGAGFTLAIANGIAFGTAITIACTTTITGSAGPAANGCVVNLGYA